MLDSDIYSHVTWFVSQSIVKLCVYNYKLPLQLLTSTYTCMYIQVYSPIDIM